MNSMISPLHSSPKVETFLQPHFHLDTLIINSLSFRPAQRAMVELIPCSEWYFQRLNFWLETGETMSGFVLFIDYIEIVDELRVTFSVVIHKESISSFELLTVQDSLHLLFIDVCIFNWKRNICNVVSIACNLAIFLEHFTSSLSHTVQPAASCLRNRATAIPHAAPLQMMIA